MPASAFVPLEPSTIYPFIDSTLLTQTPGAVASSNVAAVQEQMTGLADERELALKLAEEQESRANTFFEQRETRLRVAVEAMRTGVTI